MRENLNKEIKSIRQMINTPIKNIIPKENQLYYNDLYFSVSYEEIPYSEIHRKKNLNWNDIHFAVYFQKKDIINFLLEKDKNIINLKDKINLINFFIMNKLLYILL